VTSVGVVGSSARAAVHSLARAGFSAWAVDQFADRDLKRIAPCTICPPEGYPDAIPQLAAQFPPGPVLYTGGLENHPHILRELAAQRELWGNPADVVERVRDPFVLFPALAECGFAAPRLIPRGEPCVREGRWLRKPLRSGGGIGIRFAQPGEPASPHHYFQAFIDGAPMSAVFSGATLLGVTQQLIGEPWLHAKGFAYCGNIGPVRGPVPPAFPVPLRGVWGLDFVLCNGVAYVVEVNPRYTAAVEVLEHAVGVVAFCENPPPQPPSLKGGGSQIYSPLPSGRGAGGVGFPVGKAIYYAPHTLRFPYCGPWDADLAGDFDPWRLPKFADIPEAGSVIESGHPVLTFFATGSTPAEVRERLQSRAAELDALFQGCTP
jgi:predicted ATP-grasp superfamily ATP-dependent carboligase